MTWAERFNIAQAVVSAAVIVLAFSLRKSFSSGQILQQYVNRLEGIERRMVEAGEQMSNFATELQGYPEKIRREYVTQREADQRFSATERQLRDIWSVVNRRNRGQG